MREQIGTLSDLPEELRNTVANIYYEYACIEVERNGNPNWLPSRLPGENPSDTMRRWTARSSTIFAALNLLPKLIPGLRDLVKRGVIDAYQAAVSVALAMLKYDIRDATEKTALRLKIEKKLRSRSVHEIPALWREFKSD